MFTVAKRPVAEVEAEIANRRGDPEKVATAASDYTNVKGLVVHSRYGKADELEVLTEWAWALLPWQRALIKFAWCDSKAQWTFDIQFRLRPKGERLEEYYSIADMLALICARRVGGFNGIDCTWNSHLVTSIPAFWDDEP